MGKKIKTLGFDYLSVDGYKGSAAEDHKVLLAAGIAIIEGLNLREVEEGAYFLSSLPLLIPGADGAPSRAVLIEF